MPFTGEGCSAQLVSRLRGHLLICPDCPTKECEDGARMRRALRAVHSLLRPPEPGTPQARR